MGFTLDDEIIVTAIISVLVGFVPTYIGAIVKYRKDLEMEFDRNLREERINAYKSLWGYLSILSKHPSRNVTYKQLAELLRQLHDW